MPSVKSFASLVVIGAALAGGAAAIAAEIDGTAGNDTLFGTDRADRIRGLAGDDLIRGLAGSDRIDGGSGDDTLRGDGGCPEGTTGSPYYCIPGGPPGNDRITGGSGDDQIFGNGGRDRIFSEAATT